MPACYAHYRFGDRMIERLKPSVQKIILEDRELFDYGVQGPDIFFYNNPLSKNKVTQFGSKMHDTKASVFFKSARANYAKYPDLNEPMMAYLLGFACHYALDTICHPYIAKKMVVSNVSHYAVESEYDRHLMAEDDHFEGSCDKFKPSNYNAMVIHRFFPEFDQKTILNSLKGIKVFNEILLVTNSKTKHKVLKGLMDKIPIDSLSDHLITKEKRPKCFDSDLRLDKLSKLAGDLYVDLAYNLVAYMNGQEDLDKRFEHTFDERDEETIKDIPVFDLKGEKEYEI